MAYEGNPGTNQLAQILVGRMQKENESPLILDFAKIGPDGSLTTNTFPVTIPKGSYSVLRQLTLGATGQRLTETEDADIVKIPEKMRSIGPGDRVMVAKINMEYVVVDIVVKS